MVARLGEQDWVGLVLHFSDLLEEQNKDGAKVLARPLKFIRVLMAVYQAESKDEAQAIFAAALDDEASREERYGRFSIDIAAQLGVVMGMHYGDVPDDPLDGSGASTGSTGSSGCTRRSACSSRKGPTDSSSTPWTSAPTSWPPRRRSRGPRLCAAELRGCSASGATCRSTSTSLQTTAPASVTRSRRPGSRSGSASSCRCSRSTKEKPHMREIAATGPLSIRAISGTHVVVLAWDIDEARWDEYIEELLGRRRVEEMRHNVLLGGIYTMVSNP